MRILLDECTPVRWRRFLEDAGHPTVHWLEVGRRGAPDEAVLAWGRQSGMVVITCDNDFGQRLWESAAAAPTVIQLGGPHWRPETYGEAVLDALAACAKQTDRCVFVRILTSGRLHRVIGLPLR